MRTYREHLKNYLLPEFGNIQISKISEQDITRFQARLANSLSASRTNSTVFLLRSILKMCVRRKVIEQNPASGVESLREKRPEIDPFTAEELELALSCVSKRYRPFFIVQAWTGARPGELLALRFSDINFDRDEIHICKARVKGIEDLPKTGSSERFIPMFPPVKDALRALKNARTLTGINGNDHVFLGADNQPIDRNMDTTWAAALRKAGLKHRRSYQLRHTFASTCLQRGADPAWVSKVLGHESLEITFRHYMRFIKTPAKENERLIGSMFKKPSEMPEGTQKGTQAV